MTEPADETSLREIRRMLTALRRPHPPDVGDIVRLVVAGLQRNQHYLPAEVEEAVRAGWAIEGDLANGGLDQFVWNHRVKQAREAAMAFRAVGAVENADLLDRLSTILEDFLACRQGEPDAVRDFLAYRHLVQGPFFDCPSPPEELAEALVEYVHRNRDRITNPKAIPPDPRERKHSRGAEPPP